MSDDLDDLIALSAMETAPALDLLEARVYEADVLMLAAHAGVPLDEADTLRLAGCSLATNTTKGDNWLEKYGNDGLPEYICEVARAIKRSGRTTSPAIAIAVGRMKRWSSGVGVDADTQAKAAKALAEWEAAKARARAASAKKATKDARK